jgi:micrococcal nuclease
VRTRSGRSALERTAIVAAIVIVAVLAAGFLRREDLVEDGTIAVAAVIDGDTIEVAGGRRVRLVQIDAPEPSEGECWGSEAATELRKLLPEGTRVRLARDVRLDEVDRFGRLLRYVFTEERNVNLALVERGGAAAWFAGGRGRYADELLAASREARAARRGLWGGCPGTTLNPLRAVETDG